MIFVFGKVMDRFNSEIDDLIQITLLHAGQISKSQLTLNPVSVSRVQLLYGDFETQPLTLLRLEQLLVQKGLFSKVQALSDIMEKGILDFVAHNQRNQANKNESMFLDKMNDSQQDEANSFLKLAEQKKK